MHTLAQLVPLLIAIAAILATSMTLTPPSPVQVGASTKIVWGTAPGGTAIVPLVTGMIVTSIDITPRNPGAVGNIENADGALVDSVFLDDGFEATVEGVYDAGLTYPTQGSAITLTLPTVTSVAKADFSSGAAHSVFPCTLESNGLKFERKKEAMISFKLSHAPGRDGIASS